MTHTLRRCLPIAALCLATLLGGCVVVPAHPYWGHGWGWGYGWRR